jgi:hypothetical protein
MFNQFENCKKKNIHIASSENCKTKTMHTILMSRAFEWYQKHNKGPHGLASLRCDHIKFWKKEKEKANTNFNL